MIEKLFSILDRESCIKERTRQNDLFFEKIYMDRLTMHLHFIKSLEVENKDKKLALSLEEMDYLLYLKKYYNNQKTFSALYPLLSDKMKWRYGTMRTLIKNKLNNNPIFSFLSFLEQTSENPY